MYVQHVYWSIEENQDWLYLYLFVWTVCVCALYVNFRVVVSIGALIKCTWAPKAMMNSGRCGVCIQYVCMYATSIWLLYICYVRRCLRWSRCSCSRSKPAPPQAAVASQNQKVPALKIQKFEIRCAHVVSHFSKHLHIYIQLINKIPTDENVD